jgi:hypothetical protein
MPGSARSTGTDGSAQMVGFACCARIDRRDRCRHRRTDKLPEMSEKKRTANQPGE